MTMKLTILGCGSSGGVPRIDGDWGVCDPDEPRNRRSRCSFLVERMGNDGVTSVLVDTAPDLRTQMLAANVRHLDAVLYSHDHADQTHGIDDLRVFAYRMKRRVPVYMDAATSETLMQRFGYCFETPPGSSYPPILEAREMPAPTETMQLNGAGGEISATPLRQDHGNMDSLGFRFGDVAYSNDLVDMPEESLEALKGVRVWVVDALRRDPHPTHAHLQRTLDWIKRLKPELAILTNMHIDLDYRTLCKELPEGVIPAHDGLSIEVGQDISVCDD